MVYTQTPLDIGCDDGELGTSPGPAVITSSSTSHYGPMPWPAQAAAEEALPFECDQDHDAELSFMLIREARDAPSHSWLQTQPLLGPQHRRFLVDWMQRVRSLRLLCLCRSSSVVGVCKTCTEVADLCMHQGLCTGIAHPGVAATSLG